LLGHPDLAKSREDVADCERMRVRVGLAQEAGWSLQGEVIAHLRGRRRPQAGRIRDHGARDHPRGRGRGELCGRWHHGSEGETGCRQPRPCLFAPESEDADPDAFLADCSSERSFASAATVSGGSSRTPFGAGQSTSASAGRTGVLRTPHAPPRAARSPRTSNASTGTSPARHRAPAGGARQSDSTSGPSLN
jgi:hypothetical protein